MTAINLLPSYRRQARHRALLVRRWIVGGVCYCACIAAAVGLTRLWNAVDDRSVRLEMAGAATDSTQLGSRQAQLSSALVKLQADRLLRDTVNSPADYTILLGALGTSLKEQGVLTSLRWEVTPESTTVQRVASGERAKAVDPFAGPVRMRVELAGLVRQQPSIGRIVSAIQETHVFDEVRLMKSSREGYLTSNAFSFQIECVIHAARSGGHL